MGDEYYDRELEPPVGRLTEDDDYLDYNFDSNSTAASSVPYPTIPENLHTYHPWGIFFTIIGTVLLDFDADACQSPSRAYLLDVTLPGKEFHFIFILKK